MHNIICKVMLKFIIWSQCRCYKTLICLVPSSYSSGSEIVVNTNPVYLLACLLFFDAAACLPSQAAATFARASAKLPQVAAVQAEAPNLHFSPWLSSNQAASSFCPQNGWNVTLCGVGLIFEQSLRAWMIQLRVQESLLPVSWNLTDEIREIVRNRAISLSFIPCGVL